MKVLYMTNEPAPYTEVFFEKLSKEIDLVVIYRKKKSKERDSKWYLEEEQAYKAVFLTKNILSNIIVICKMFFGQYDLYVNGDYTNIYCTIASIIAKMKRKKILLNADGGLPPLKKNAMHFVVPTLMKLATDYASSGVTTDAYFNYYGIYNKIHHYRFTSLTEAELESNREIIQKSAVKGLNKGKITILSVGQQIHRKGYDILIKSLPYIDEENIFIKIIGGSPLPENKKLIDDMKITNIEFIPFVKKTELTKYFLEADIFVLPTREDIWGLVVNEAMSFGLPVISTNRCVAAMEFNEIFNAGIIVPIEDEVNLGYQIKRLITSEQLYKDKVSASLSAIESYSIENMAVDYLNILKMMA